MSKFPVVWLSVCLLALLLVVPNYPAQETQTKRQIRVFVALCDNKTQGIAKVNPRIGDGDKPASNLYWGCSDGMSAYFKKSWLWNLVKSETSAEGKVLERLTFQHTKFTDVELVAEAYRGSEMKACLVDFFDLVSSEKEPNVKAVAFIGHNGLMEHQIPNPMGATKRDAVVLGCFTDSYFSKRLALCEATPVLMTKSLMYPGSFLLHDALEGWLRKESKAQLRERAAKAYAKNQNISVSAARSIFAKLEE